MCQAAQGVQAESKRGGAAGRGERGVEGAAQVGTCVQSHQGRAIAPCKGWCMHRGGVRVVAPRSRRQQRGSVGVTNVALCFACQPARPRRAGATVRGVRGVEAAMHARTRAHVRAARPRRRAGPGGNASQSAEWVGRVLAARAALTSAHRRFRPVQTEGVGVARVSCLLCEA